LKKILILSLILVLSIFILAGCVTPPVCGNGICEAGENSSNCPADCGTELGYLDVSVSDANTGLALGGATVFVYPDEVPGCGISVDAKPTTSETDGEGMAYFKLAPGDYAIDAWASGYKLTDPNFICITVNAGENYGASIILEKDLSKVPCQGLPGTTEMSPGETIEVDGVGDYNGEKLTIELTDIVAWGAFQGYGAKWTLMDDGIALKIAQMLPPALLADHFGSQYFNTRVEFESVCWKNDEPYAVVSILEPLEIRNNQVFPYNSSQTTNPQWKASFSTNQNGITGIQVKNNWSYIQTKTEQSNSKLVLGEGDSIEIDGRNFLAYFSGENNKEYKSTIGGENLFITDTKGVMRDIPLVISLEQGTNEIEISGNIYTIDINTAIDAARFWFAPVSGIADPWGNPPGTKNVDYTDRGYDNDTVRISSHIQFIIDSDTNMHARYHIGADETTGQFWLLLAGQQWFEAKGTNIFFNGTTMDNNISTSYNQVPYYWPDQSTYNVLENAGFTIAPTSGDNYEFVALWSSTNQSKATEIYQSTEAGLLVNSTNGKTRISQADVEVRGNGWTLNEYSTNPTTRLLQAYTEYGTRFLVNQGVVAIYSVENQRNFGVGLSAQSLGGITLQPISTDGSTTMHRLKTSTGTDYNASLVLESAAVLQDIADGVYPGEIVLKIQANDFSYNIDFTNPIIPGEEREIFFMGKTYKIIEATMTKLILEEVVLEVIQQG